MASRILARSRALPSVRQVISRRGYATEHVKHAGEQPKFQPETFGSNAWRNTMFVVIAGLVWYRVDQHITTSGDEKHPITKWVEYHMTPATENDRVASEHLDHAVSKAEDRLLFQEAQRAPVYRMRYPEAFERASPHAIAVGSQVDLSDLKVKTN
ncbi:hypothetical protein VKS41_005952 [Umbelopsis sp. WA50703]